MIRPKEIVRVAICSAMLIGGQLALSGVSGIEIVTVLLLSFCYLFGIKIGVLIATTFSLLRCFIFGFYVNVLVLYLVYYNLFAIFFGWLGKRFSDASSSLKIITVVAAASLFSVLFTLLDDVLTPLMLGLNAAATRIYFFASLHTMFLQLICTVVTVSVFFHPITRAISKTKF